MPLGASIIKESLLRSLTLSNDFLEVECVSTCLSWFLPRVRVIQVLQSFFRFLFPFIPSVPLPLRKRVTQRRRNFVWYNRTINEVEK